MERDGVFHKSQNNEKNDRLMKKSTIACVEIVSEGHYLVVLLSVTEYGQHRWEGSSIIDGIAGADDTVMAFVAAQIEKKEKAPSRAPRHHASPNIIYDATEGFDIIPDGGRHGFFAQSAWKNDACWAQQ